MFLQIQGVISPCLEPPPPGAVSPLRIKGDCHVKTLACYEEVGALLRRKPNTIYRWARNGIIPSIAVGKDYVFDLEEVSRWVEGKDAQPRKKARK